MRRLVRQNYGTTSFFVISLLLLREGRKREREREREREKKLIKLDALSKLRVGTRATASKPTLRPNSSRARFVPSSLFLLNRRQMQQVSARPAELDARPASRRNRSFGAPWPVCFGPCNKWPLSGPSGVLVQNLQRERTLRWLVARPASAFARSLAHSLGPKVRAADLMMIILLDAYYEIRFARTADRRAAALRRKGHSLARSLFLPLLAHAAAIMQQVVVVVVVRLARQVRNSLPFFPRICTGS